MKIFIKKLSLILLIGFVVTMLFSALSFSVFAQGAAEDTLDLDCVREKITTGGDVKECTGVGGGGTSGDFNTNFFGVTLTADQAGFARLVRSGITVALGLFVVVAVFYGFWGIYVRSTAGDNEDKMKESVKIFKNAILGIIITVVGFVVVQLISVIFGLGNIWELDFSLSKADGCDPSVGVCNVFETEGGTCLNAINEQKHGECCVYNFTNGQWVKDPGSCSNI